MKPDAQELLQRIAWGELDPEDEVVREAAAKDAEFAEAARQCGALQRMLDDAAHVEATVLAAAEVADRSPGEDRIAETLTGQNEQSLPSAARPARRVPALWIAAAAALAAAPLWMFWPEKTDPAPFTMEHEALACLEPVDTYRGRPLLRWQGARSESQSFEVFIYRAHPETRVRGGLIGRSLQRIEENSWQPSPTDMKELPGAIYWEVVLRGADGAELGRAGAFARRGGG